MVRTLWIFGDAISITNTLATFINLMNRVFKPFLDQFVVIFIDDILIYFKSKEELEENLRCILQIFREKKLFAKLSKYEFWLDIVAFLRHVISKEEISIDPKKVKAIVSWSRPTNVSKIHSFLDLVAYYL